MKLPTDMDHAEGLGMLERLLHKGDHPEYSDAMARVMRAVLHRKKQIYKAKVQQMGC